MLDRQGILAAWREGLMAQSVIRKLQAGEKPGYRNHPQLRRFLAQPDPLQAIGTWLTYIQEGATRRGYSFDRSKIVRPGVSIGLTVTNEQLEYEFLHLQDKLFHRDNDRYWSNFELYNDSGLNTHPMFSVVVGPVEAWEKIH